MSEIKEEQIVGIEDTILDETSAQELEEQIAANLKLEGDIKKSEEEASASKVSKKVKSKKSKEEQIETPVEEKIETPVEEKIETPVEEQIETPTEEQIETPTEEQIETPTEEQIETPEFSIRERFERERILTMPDTIKEEIKTISKHTGMARLYKRLIDGYEMGDLSFDDLKCRLAKKCRMTSWAKKAKELKL